MEWHNRNSTVTNGMVKIPAGIFFSHGRVTSLAGKRPLRQRSFRCHGGIPRYLTVNRFAAFMRECLANSFGGELFGAMLSWWWCGKEGKRWVNNINIIHSSSMMRMVLDGNRKMSLKLSFAPSFFFNPCGTEQKMFRYS